MEQMQTQVDEQMHMACKSLEAASATGLHMGAPGHIQWPPPLLPPASMPHLMPMGGPMGGPAMATPPLMLAPMGMPPLGPAMNMPTPMRPPMSMPPSIPARDMPPPMHTMGLPPPMGLPINPSARMILPNEQIIRVGNMRMAKAGESVQFMAKNPANKVQVYDDQAIRSTPPKQPG